MPNDRPASAQIGQRIRGEVYKILPYAVLIRLPGGLHGIVRQREMSWEVDRPDPEALFKLGDMLDAIVLKISEEENSIELSLRLVQNDPWGEFTRTYQPGDIVSGVVRGVREFGAFVEIQKAVEGLVPVSEIRAEGRVEKAQEALWVGDEVVAVIQDIQPERRQLRLSIKAYLESQVVPDSKGAAQGQTPISDFLDPMTRRRLRQAMGDIPDETIWPEPGRIQRILIADDHDKFRQSLAQTLRDWGYSVLETNNLESTRQQIEIPLDLAILDFHMSDGSTIALAKDIIGKQENIPILLLSGFEVDEKEIQEARSSGFVVEYKPFGPSDMLEYLQNLEQTESGPASHPSEPQNPVPESSQSQIPETHLNNVYKFLERLEEETKAQGIALFRESTLNPGEIEWPYIVNLDISSSDASTTLQYSPVGDVLFGQEIQEIQDASEHPARLKYLLPAIPFRACIGVPVQASVSSSRHALFLFSYQAGAFSEIGHAWLQEQAQLLAKLLEQEQVSNLFITTQADLLRSQLRAGALHEVRNSLGGLEYVLDGLMRRILEVDQPVLPHSSTLESFRTTLLEAQAFTRQMKKTAELFRELGLSTKLELASLNDIVRRSVERQSPLGSHLGVHLDFKPDNNMPAILLRPAHLQQVVENVILNAVQWCTNSRLRKVSVSSAYRTDGQDLPVEIRVTDTGPGIHRQLQENHIFEMGYSTRPDGSGLGLFVARILLQSMGGIIVVEHSVMEIGTTFCIKLPCNQNLPS